MTESSKRKLTQNILGYMRRLFSHHPEEQDVPIKCSDGEARGHSLILAAFSSLLKDYLLESAQSAVHEPMIILPDVSVNDVATFFEYVLGKDVSYDHDVATILRNLLHILGVDQVSPELAAILNGAPCSTQSGHSKCDDVQMENADQEDDGMSNDSDLEMPIQEFPATTPGLNTALFPCPFCHHKYQHAKAKNKHMLSMHQDECRKQGLFHQCQFCHMQFVSLIGKEQHIKRIHPRSASKEKRANQTQGSPIDGIDDHTALRCPFQHEGEDVVQERSLWDLRQHIRKCHPDKELFCILCGQELGSKEAILEHMQSHDNRHLHSCDVCNLKLLSEYALIAHKREAHSLNDVFTCKYCSRRFRNAKFCRNHELRHTTGQLTDEHQCLFVDAAGNVCNKTFANKNNLLRHKQQSRHGGDDGNITQVARRQSFVCDICSKTFVDSTRLKEHKWIHRDYRPHKCAECGHGFRHKSHLNAHMVKQHGQKKKFACQVCDKTFIYAYQLRTHMDRHERGMPRKGDTESSTRLQDKGDITNPSNNAWISTIYQCALCHDIYDSYVAFQQHCDSKHTGPSEAESCVSQSLLSVDEESSTSVTFVADHGEASQKNVLVAVGNAEPSREPGVSVNDRDDSRFIIVYEGNLS